MGGFTDRLNHDLTHKLTDGMINCTTFGGINNFCNVPIPQGETVWPRA